MSRYYSFNDFMGDVLKRADEICQRDSNCSLEELYKVSSTTKVAIINLIARGWVYFLGVAGLLALGPLGLGLAIMTFLATPIGAVVAVVLGVGAVAIIKQMYHDRVLPNAVKEIGEKYKSKWEAIEGNLYRIDELVNQAALELYMKANNANYIKIYN